MQNGSKQDSGEFDLVNITKRGNPRRVVRERVVAYEMGERLPLVCATMPIIGTNNIVELFRSPKKRVMGNKWIFFLSEHEQIKDASPRQALKRGFQEELGYRPKEILDTRNSINIEYHLKNCTPKVLRWSAHIYIVPVRNIDDLKPDGEEILDIRSRPLSEVIHGANLKRSAYRMFSPHSFMEYMFAQTQIVLDSYKSR